MNATTTSGPLEQMRLDSSATSVNSIRMWHVDGDLDMDQPYQRGHVWGEERQRNLIRSILLGIPIPALVVNQRHLGRFHHPGYSDDRNAAYSIVDGKQRITAIVRYLRDGLMLPAAWFKPEDIVTTIGTDRGPMVRFCDLTRARQLDILMTPIPLVQGRLSTLAEEQTVFDLINFGGVAQGSADPDSPTAVTTVEDQP